MNSCSGKDDSSQSKKRAKKVTKSKYEEQKTELQIVHKRLSKFNVYADDVAKFYNDYQKLEEISNDIISYISEKPSEKDGDEYLILIVDSYEIVGRSHFDTNKKIAEAYIVLIKAYPDSKHVSKAEEWLEERNVSY